MIEEGIARVRALLEPLEAAGAWSGLSALYTTLAGLLFSVAATPSTLRRPGAPWSWPA